MWYIYTIEYYSAIKKDEYLLFTLMWFELAVIILSEISHSYDFTHMWNIRNKTNEQREKEEREANQVTDS